MDLPKKLSENFDKDKEEEHLYSHLAGKSKVWMHLEFHKNSNGKLTKDKVVCRICSMPITYSGNTTNMTYYLLVRFILFLTQN